MKVGWGTPPTARDEWCSSCLTFKLICIVFDFFFTFFISPFPYASKANKFALWGPTRKSHPVRSTDATTPHHRGARSLRSVLPPFHASIVVLSLFHGGNKLSWFDLDKLPSYLHYSLNTGFFLILAPPQLYTWRLLLMTVGPVAIIWTLACYAVSNFIQFDNIGWTKKGNNWHF